MKFKFLPTSDTYGKTLVELGNNNPDIFVLEADLMKASGSKLFKENFPDRHINVGVAEQNLIGVAAGLAAMGRIPFACTMANFISQRACDQVTISIAFNKFNVKVIGCYAGLSQEKNGATHIGFMDIAIMRCLPNMKVIIPSDHCELSNAIKMIAKIEGPVYLRMSKILPEKIFDSSYKFNLKKGIQVGSGKDLTIISTGIASVIALEALEELKKENICARLIHLPVIKPVDAQIVLKSARETGALITIEDHSIFGGLGGLISEIISENYPIILERIGMNDMFGLTANLDFQLNYFGISVENIIKVSKSILAKKKTV